MPLPAATLTAVVKGQHVNEDQTGSLSGERPAPAGPHSKRIPVPESTTRR